MTDMSCGLKRGDSPVFSYPRNEKYKCKPIGSARKKYPSICIDFVTLSANTSTLQSPSHYLKKAVRVWSGYIRCLIKRPR